MELINLNILRDETRSNIKRQYYGCQLSQIKLADTVYDGIDKMI